MATEDMVFRLSKVKQLNVSLNEIDSNFITISNDEYSLIGILLFKTEKSKKIIDKAKLDNSKTNNVEDDGSLCLPDSTLSVNAFESSGSSNNDQICSKCNAIINKRNSRKALDVNKSKKSTASIKVAKSKSDKLRLHEDKVISSDSKFNSRKRKLDSNSNVSEIKKHVVDSTPSRRLHSRAIKTEANERIIELATYKSKIAQKSNKSKDITTSDNSVYHEEQDVNNNIVGSNIDRVESVKIVKQSKSTDSHLNSENNDKDLKKRRLKKTKIDNVKQSDVSVYDFREDDIQSESVDTAKQKKSKTKKHQSDAEIKSNPDTTSFEHEGEKISINDIVWGKYPSLYLWPCRVRSFKKDNVNDCNKLCNVEWIGSDKKSNLPVHTLFPFEKYFVDSYSSRKRTDKYKDALVLACHELKLDLNELINNAAVVNPKISKSNKNNVNATASNIERKMTTDLKQKRSRSIKSVSASIDENDKGSSSNDNKADVTSVNRKKTPLNFDDVIFQSPTNNQKDVSNKNNTLTTNDQVTSFSDEDTDEEEKARGVLITAESLESRNIFNNDDEDEMVLQD